MSKTIAPTAPAQPREVPLPPGGGSYVFDPATGQLIREGGTEPQTGCTPNPAFDAEPAPLATDTKD